MSKILIATESLAESAIAVSQTITTPGPDLEFGIGLASVLAVLAFVLQTLHIIY